MLPKWNQSRENLRTENEVKKWEQDKNEIHTENSIIWSWIIVVSLRCLCLTGVSICFKINWICLDCSTEFRQHKVNIFAHKTKFSMLSKILDRIRHLQNPAPSKKNAFENSLRAHSLPKWKLNWKDIAMNGENRRVKEIKNSEHRWEIFGYQRDCCSIREPWQHGTIEFVFLMFYELLTTFCYVIFSLSKWE